MFEYSMIKENQPVQNVKIRKIKYILNIPDWNIN